MATDRAVLFVDGNNWYHGLRAIGVTNLLELNYATISKKLAGPRTWVGTRYYIGRVQQTPLGAQAYADQRRFLARLQRSDSRISIHLGRLEPRTVENPAATELQQYLHGLTTKIDRQVFHDLMDLSRRP